MSTAAPLRCQPAAILGLVALGIFCLSRLRFLLEAVVLVDDLGGVAVRANKNITSGQALVGTLSSPTCALYMSCRYGWMPHNAGFDFLDIVGATLGRIHF
jgi:hypothetical protein